MGGAVNVPGNVKISSGLGNDLAEWNIYADPGAAAVVLGSGVPLTLVPLDATSDVPVTTKFHNKLKRDRGTPSAEFVYRVLVQKEADIKSGYYFFWDPLAAAVVIDPTLADYKDMVLSVVVEEGPESGRVLVGDGVGRFVWRPGPMPLTLKRCSW